MSSPSSTSSQVILEHFIIKVNGSLLNESVMNQVLTVTVQDDLDVPDLCTISFEDQNAEILDNHPFSLGATVNVDIAVGSQTTPIFTGEVTGYHHDLNAMGSRIVTIEAMHKSHRLNRARDRKAFQNVTFSDVASQLAGAAGLTISCEATTEVFKWLFQNNETHFEFLKRCAHEAGYELQMERDGKLAFRKAVQTSRPECATLKWGDTLRSFNISTKASGQVDKVVAKGWDTNQKQAIVGQATSSTSHPQIGLGKSGGEAARSAFSAASLEVVDLPVLTQSHATQLAQGVLDEINSGFVTATGTSYGVAAIKSGNWVTVESVGTNYSGKYYLTSVTHHYTPAEGYTTSFECSGKRPATLASLMSGSDDRFKSRLGNSIVVGIVTNNDVGGDGSAGPNMGMVKVKFPWLQDDQESYWCRVCAPDAGPKRGFNFLPEVNDEVLVAFEHGDMRRGYIIGRLWNGRDEPTEPISSVVKGGKVVKRQMKSRTGHIIEFNEDAGVAEDIHFKTALGKHDFLYSDKEQKCVINTGPSMVTMEWDCQGHMTIKCVGNVKYDVTGNFDIDAKGKVTIKGLGGIQIDTPATLSCNGTSTAEFKSAGSVTVNGSTSTTIGTSGMITITGGMVKIN